MVLPDDPEAREGDGPGGEETGRRIARAGPWRHRAPVGPPHPGSAHAVVAGVPCAALPLPWAWAAQACLTAVADDDLVEVAGEVAGWLARHGRAGWQLEVGSDRAPVLVDALGLTPVREHEVRVSTGQPPEVGGPVDVVPPPDEETFLAVFGPGLAPVVRGQLGRPDWEVAMLREDGEDVTGSAALPGSGR